MENLLFKMENGEFAILNFYLKIELASLLLQIYRPYRSLVSVRSNDVTAYAFLVSLLTIMLLACRIEIAFKQYSRY